MPKANTCNQPARMGPQSTFYGFNDLHATTIWHGACLYHGQVTGVNADFEPIGTRRFHMFDGKNNRILDSFSFRLALTAAVFAAWSAAGYVLLSLV
ncbi:MAG: hypothetical protein WA738_07540 [Candidatus Angelobacter sp.]